MKVRLHVEATVTGVSRTRLSEYWDQVEVELIGNLDGEYWIEDDKGAERQLTIDVQRVELVTSAETGDRSTGDRPPDDGAPAG